MLIIKDICHSYNMKKVLNNFSFCFEDNSIYAIMGESGCGKSTLLKIISGLLKPMSGSVLLINSKEKIFINGPNKNIFMMHQGYTSFPWKNSLENVLFPLKIKKYNIKKYKDEAKKLLTLVGLEDNLYKYPAEMSGGQRQRLALARVLISKPNIILMDEPLSALDEITRAKMQNLLKEFQNETKCLIIMITHDKNEAIKMANTNIIEMKKIKES